MFFKLPFAISFSVFTLYIYIYIYIYIISKRSIIPQHIKYNPTVLNHIYIGVSVLFIVQS